jgi:hypothetical protein
LLNLETGYFLFNNIMNTLVSLKADKGEDPKKWVEEVAQRSGVPIKPIDIGVGYTFIGSPKDEESRKKVEETIVELENTFKGKIEFSLHECDPEIYKNGITVARLDGRSEKVQRYVRTLARKANARLDWHLSGGIAQVLYLGNEEGRKRVEQVIKELGDSGDVDVIQIMQPEEKPLFRDGVDEWPEGFLGIDNNQ